MINRIQYQLRNALTVAQLRDALEYFDDDALVVFTTSYGDYGDTMQALPVEATNALTNNYLTECDGYSRSGVAILTDPEGSEPDEDRPTVVVLSMDRETPQF